MAALLGALALLLAEQQPASDPAEALRQSTAAHDQAKSTWAGCEIEVVVESIMYRTVESALRPSWPLRRFVARPNDGRFVHNAVFSYRPPFRPFRYHPNAARSPLKPIETASGC